jgi:GDPmannose 4,6-dehydratase
MLRILQHSEPDDFVIATGESHSVEEFVRAAFAAVGAEWREFVEHDARYDRPAEVDFLLGDASKARKVLGWEPTTRFPELVRLMVAADLHAAGLNPEGILVDG